MEQWLFWLYIVNGTQFVLFEMEIAYRRRWKILRSPNGIGVFLTLHLPAVFLLLIGVIPVYSCTFTGLCASFCLGAGGIVTFFLYLDSIKRGKPFTILTLIQLGVLLLVSTAEIALALNLFIARRTS